MSIRELEGSSDNRAVGIMTSHARRFELRRVLAEMRTPDDDRRLLLDRLPPSDAWIVDAVEASAAADLCYRLYCKDVAEYMAARLGVDGDEYRRALDGAIRMSFPAAGGSQ